MSHLKRAREVFDIELAAVKAVRSHLAKSFDQAVELIASALAKRRKIVVLGVGKSGNIGRKIAATWKVVCMDEDPTLLCDQPRFDGAIFVRCSEWKLLANFEALLKHHRDDS